ncbi:hypothetical protein BH18VER1_BH18VER1_08710 [soil metagenome]
MLKLQQLRFSAVTIACLVLASCGRETNSTPAEGLQRATAELSRVKTPEDRFYALNEVAKESFAAGNAEDARTYAEELLKLMPSFRPNWNYGNALHDANMVLGRIAARDNRIDDAKRYLLESGKTPGSPQLDSFGPNMSLAKDLLEKGERDSVLEYFGMCRRFWKMHGGRLNKWTVDVQHGRIPDFGANLFY